MKTHTGGCHCGKLRFEFEAPADLEATRCNCSICSMTGFLHYIVSRENFHLLGNEDDITSYTFNTGVAQHYFCKHCGIKSFYVPRSHPDGISVNLNCVERATIDSISVAEFDGTNWEQNVSGLSPISD